ncbi:alpha/beta hydrolase-like protein, partial [Delitschia confertaspora ATCC 74209]
MTAARPMTAAEVVKHPEYPYIIWDLKPEKKGQVTVAKNRGGPINIAYEVHGHGDKHMVWIMGLGGMGYSWQRQTKDFAHTQADKYTSLVFDNRGIGESDKPCKRYTTSEMAKDTLELIDHIGWTRKRELHIVGISMGGMIAQELAWLIPDRVCTLSLVSTAAGLFNTIGFIENLKNRANLFIPKPVDIQIANLKRNLFTADWLSEPDALASESIKQPFPQNGDRVTALELTKRAHPSHFKPYAFILQAIAANWHSKSPAQLHELAEKVGRRRIMVVHGGKDRMITFPHGVVLWRGLEKGLGKEGWEEWGLLTEEEEREVESREGKGDVWAKGEVEKHFFLEQGHCLPI